MQKQRLQQTQKQKLTLTPQQVQQIRMFELTTLELEERIIQELEENPILEEGTESALEEISENFDTQQEGDNSDISEGEYRNEEDIPDSQQDQYRQQSSDMVNDNFNWSVSETLHDYLISQISLKDITESDLAIAEYLIGNIDDDGYLRTDLQSISDELLFKLNIDITIEKLSEILEVIQELEPSGIGARSLHECMMLQLERRRGTEINRIAYSIISNYFEDYVQRRYDKIINKLSIDESMLKMIMDEIQTLTPKPGAPWSSDIYQEKSTAVTPDFIIEEDNGSLTLSMNQENLPELRVSKHYSNLVEDYNANRSNQTLDRKNEIQYLNEKLNSAKNFIEMLKTRQTTLMKTMQSIMDIQKAFILSGDEKELRPMTLQNVADICGYDISTISRVSNSKYVQTPFGLFPLKHFFSDSMQNEDGEEISNREIKAIVRELIETENKKTPLTDEKLCNLLHSKGYIIARRTVAKYREQLGIPVARQRKEL
ncbi:MAG: RNA polymerase factor sigma-54 [Bacteroidales bacterium]